ncbi:hypothetical protein [Actinomarinicola tropica]|uniref:Uncharacterized protein n=1 Tax=Actinomarinicola tropica TaxID=2789776 RepID=A0A5Q2RKY2_9ACTN|nr:hypothetical protein [Actinomarinicola tropica]QGG96144.1 hypothetical protein GH723_14125 [Actinomarinicola tropica]
MKIEKLNETNAFVAIDLEGAPCSTGVVRAAGKVLQGGAKAMARTTTYTFALRELQVGGASAGISADDDAREAAIAAFVEELAPRAASGELVLDAGKGVDPAALQPLREGDPRAALRDEAVDGHPLPAHLHALGVVVAAEAALGSLDGVTAAVEPGPDAERIGALLEARGAASVTPDLTAEADVLLCGSRQGMVDGAMAAAIRSKVVVPTGPHALSAKGLAVLNGRDVVALPDFLTLAGPTFAGWPADADTPDAAVAAAEAWVAATVREVMSHDEGPVLGACYAAEAFLSTWRDELPFGRPLA